MAFIAQIFSTTNVVLKCVLFSVSDQFVRWCTLSDGPRQHVWTKTTRRRSFLISLCFLLSSGSRSCHREVSYSLCLYLSTYTEFYCISCEQKTGFVFRRSRVQISARRLAILTEIPKGFSSIHSLKWPGRRHDHFHTFPFISYWSFLYLTLMSHNLSRRQRP
jgi:hypothetical protein